MSMTTEELLDAAAKLVTNPKHRALILCGVYRCRELARGAYAAKYVALGGRYSLMRRTWTFPSGASITFGVVDVANDEHRFLGAAYNFVGFDTSSRATIEQKDFLRSRARHHDGLKPVVVGHSI